jgi:hypothetical protein
LPSAKVSSGATTRSKRSLALTRTGEQPGPLRAAPSSEMAFEDRPGLIQQFRRNPASRRRPLQTDPVGRPCHPPPAPASRLSTDPPANLQRARPSPRRGRLPLRPRRRWPRLPTNPRALSAPSQKRTPSSREYDDCSWRCADIKWAIWPKVCRGVRADAGDRPQAGRKAPAADISRASGRRPSSLRIRHANLLHPSNAAPWWTDDDIYFRGMRRSRAEIGTMA